MSWVAVGGSKKTNFLEIFTKFPRHSEWVGNFWTRIEKF